MPNVVKIHLIAAARPNFMKVAPLYHALAEQSWCELKLVHTGQHYDANMSDSFFRDLQLPDPDFHLGVGGGTHAEQTAGVMVEYERVCLENRPDWVVVVGDVNSTLACTLAASKLAIKIVHLEAGLRSFDNSMPEEINRIVTDSLADLLWTPSPDGDENLLKSGVAPGKIDRIGNIMIDSFELVRPKIERANVPEILGVKDKRYAVVTLHRPSNVDRAPTLQKIVDEMIAIAASGLALVFPLHPRTRKSIEQLGVLEQLSKSDGIYLLEPLSYVEFMSIVLGCRLVITDSGGIQEETTYLGIPCLTLRENTERPITISEGTNLLIGPDELGTKIDEIMQKEFEPGRIEFWDGKTAQRAVESLYNHACLRTA